MRILDQAFNGAKEYYFTDWCSQYTAGSGRWFPEFTPVNLIALGFIFDLLKHFWRHDICCHIICSFPNYLAGLQTGCQRVSFFIAMKESPLVNLIFQRKKLSIGRFHFTLYKSLPHADVCMYFVRGSLDYCFTFLGIDCLFECDTRSNILHTFHMENSRGSVRFPAACKRSVSRPGTFHDPSAVCKTLRCAECRVDLQLGLWYLRGCGLSTGPPFDRLPSTG